MMDMLVRLALLILPASLATDCCDAESDYAPEGGCTDEVNNETGLVCADSDTGGLECVTSDDWDASVDCSQCCVVVSDDDLLGFGWGTSSSSSGGVGIAVTLVIVFSLTCFCCCSCYLYRRRKAMPFAPTTVVATEASPMSEARMEDDPSAVDKEEDIPVATPQQPPAEGIRVTDPMELGNRVSTSALLDAPAPDPSSSSDPSATITSAHL